MKRLLALLLLCGTAHADVLLDYSTTGIYPPNSLPAHVQTLENEVIALTGTATKIVITPGPGSATFSLGTDVPLLDGANVYTANQEISGTEPRYLFNETDQGADLKTWDIDVASAIFSLRTRTDLDGSGCSFFSATRGATTAVTNLTFGCSGTNYTFNGLGATFNGSVSASALVPTSTGLGAANSARANAPASCEFGIATNATQAAIWDCNQQLILGGNLVAAGPVPTITTITGTCTYATPTGGAHTSWMVISGGSGTCSFKATYAVSQTNGYQCSGSDETQVTQAITASHTANSCTVRVTSVAASDVVSWSANPG